MELILIRHGRVDSSKRRFNEKGRSDPPLSDLGLEQAELVVKRLDGKHIDAIYVSDLCRTHQTAEPLASERGITPIERPEWGEVYLGEFEGRSFANMLKERDTTYLKFLETRSWETFPGAESDSEVRSRVKRAIDELENIHDSQTVAVFTHGGIINAALAIALDVKRMVLISPENGSITSIWMKPRPPLVITVNDTSHLKDRDPLRHDPLYEPSQSS